MRIIDFLKRIKYKSVDFGLLTSIKLVVFKKFNYKKYKKIIVNYLIKNYGTNFEDHDKKNIDCISITQKNIWFYWAQGYDNMPALIQKCYNNILTNASNYKVNFICEENLSNFIDIPDYIYKKYNEGLISKTHFSDFVRIALLKEYGGIWLDSTIYTSNIIPTYIMGYKLFSKKETSYKSDNISEGKWATYFLATNEKNNILFCCLYEFYKKYWYDKKQIIDYLLFDYAIYVAYIKIKKVKDLIDNIPENNVAMLNLAKIINEPYNEEIWRKISKDTFLHKLSRKRKIVNNNYISFYDKIVLGK